MSSQTAPTIRFQPTVCYAVGHRVQLVGGPHVGKTGVIRALGEKVYVVLDNGVHVQGNYTLFKKVD